MDDVIRFRINLKDELCNDGTSITLSNQAMPDALLVAVYNNEKSISVFLNTDQVDDMITALTYWKTTQEGDADV